ncbi:hypothetical protein [uncultured Dokdonia sp.]|uniref:hypothetical protein n=1 Tax=Dokdonia sp. R78006 TaxID=3093866 RepID=UPI002623DE51|nr:hypothetical protein [uncultured Dokdonia sp.]
MEENLEPEIEQYLGGMMTPEQELAFENKMSADITLYEEVLLIEDINLYLNDKFYDNSKSQDIDLNTNVSLLSEKEIRERIEEVNSLYKAKNFSKNRRSRIVYCISSTAAIIMLCMGIYFFYSKKSNLDLYTAFYSENDLPSFTTRSVDVNLLSQIEKSFKAGDIDIALENLNAYINTSEYVDPLSYIYKGLIYSEKGQLSEAIKQLEILKNSDSLDAEKATWFEALVYLKFEDENNVELLLRDIASNPSHYKYSEAIALLDKL